MLQPTDPEKLNNKEVSRGKGLYEAHCKGEIK